MMRSMRSWNGSSDRIFRKMGPSQEDLRAEKILQESCKDIGGRYEVGLLWKHERDVTAKMMPSSESEVMARQRTLKCFHRR